MKNIVMRPCLFKLVLSVMLIAVLLPSGVVLAAPPQPGAGSFTNSGDVPPGSTLVLNVTLNVANDEDSGNVGYWALDNYNRTVKVWQVPDGSYYVVAKYTGKWETFAGAKSPGVGLTITKDAQGTMEGGYVGTFDATSVISTFGHIGGKDYGGTKADILLGTYGAGQAGPTTPFSFLSTYFTGASNFNYLNWGWTYKYQNQRWNNFDYGTTGDIAP